MRIPKDRRYVAIVKRDASSSTLIVVAVVVLGILVLSIILHLVYRSYAGKQRRLYGGGSDSRSRGQYSSHLQGDELSVSTDRRERRDLEREMASGNRNSAASGVGRTTSIRSVITLPTYTPAAREDETILGREGERGGVDVVVEFPESAADVESRREHEMESLYQIRVARRAEAAEREERRRQRREARARGDYQALSVLRQRAEAAAADSVSQTLIVEHQGQDRSRRVSSVQYAEVGLARHDGSRVRANSTESERPLLDSAASIGDVSIEPRSISSLSIHQRPRSVSVSTAASDDYTPTQRTISGGSINTNYEAVSLNTAHSRSPSISHSVIITAPDSDVGDQAIPPMDPPMYDDLTIEDAPPYSSPVQTRAPQLPTPSQIVPPQLPGIERLPSIRITSAVSPTAEGPRDEARDRAQGPNISGT